MATYVDDVLRDAWLGALSSVNELHITNGVVTSYAGLATATLGKKTAPTIGPVGDANPNGRKRTVAAFGDGDVTANSGSNQADHWCLVDTTNSRVLVSGQLSASQVTYEVNTFSMSSFDIRNPDQA